MPPGDHSGASPNASHGNPAFSIAIDKARNVASFARVWASRSGADASGKALDVVRRTFSPKPRKCHAGPSPRHTASPDQLARRQRRPHLLRGQRLTMHRPEPAESQYAARVPRVRPLAGPRAAVAVDLHRHDLEGLAHVPRLQQRRSLHNAPWSSLDDAGSGFGGLRSVADTIILGDDRPTANRPACHLAEPVMLNYGFNGSPSRRGRRPRRAD
jgi:hypothetical protein